MWTNDLVIDSNVVTGGTIPTDVVAMNLHLKSIAYSIVVKSVRMVELMMWWETRVEEAHKKKY